MNKLIIFDLDGVIIDTEYPTFEYYRRLLPQYGWHLREADFQYKIGRKSVDFFRSVMGRRFDPELVEYLTQRKRRDFQSDVRRYVKLIPGVVSLIKACWAAGLTLAIGSQNERDMVEVVVQEFSLRTYFSIIRSLQDIRQKKPAPEIFTGIAASLGVLPQESVVLEDSPDGVAAGRAGGFKVVGVNPRREALADVDLWVASPAELTAQQLAKLEHSGKKKAARLRRKRPLES